jgi:hypothetical protein
MEINIDLLDVDQDLESVYPFKEWVRSGKNQEAQSPAIRVFNIDSHIDEYLKIIELCLQFADLETTFPTSALIEPQAIGKETAQGASIRAGNVNITVKDIAKEFDTFTAEILEAVYTWNMEFNDREDIKGDYKVRAKGLTSLIAKEVRAAVLQNATTTIVPKYETWIKEYEFLQEVWKSLDLPLEILRTEDEHAQYMQEITDPRDMELKWEFLEAQLKELKAKAISYLARAKKAKRRRRRSRYRKREGSIKEECMPTSINAIIERKGKSSKSKTAQHALIGGPANKSAFGRKINRGHKGSSGRAWRCP